MEAGNDVGEEAALKEEATPYGLTLGFADVSIQTRPCGRRPARSRTTGQGASISAGLASRRYCIFSSGAVSLVSPMSRSRFLDQQFDAMLKRNPVLKYGNKCRASSVA